MLPTYVNYTSNTAFEVCMCHIIILCHSAWEDQRRRCANICHMALPARASQCQYENSGTPASLISHALNEILALGIPRYTYGQLVATAFSALLEKKYSQSTEKKKRHKTECSLKHLQTFQGSTGRDRSLSATRYIPHSPVRLHSPHTAP